MAFNQANNPQTQKTLNYGGAPAKSQDLSSVLMVQQDLKSSFRNLEQQKERLVKGLHRSHDKFYKKLIKEKRQALAIQLQMNKEGGISSGMYRLLGVESSTIGQMFRDDLDGNGTMSYIIETNAPQIQASIASVSGGGARQLGGSKTRLSPVRNSHPTENSKVALNILQQTMKSADNNFEGNVLIENQLTYIEVDDFTKHIAHQQLQNPSSSHYKIQPEISQTRVSQQNASNTESANPSPKKGQEIRSNRPIALNRNQLIYPPTQNKKLDLIGKTKYSQNSTELHYLAKYREELLEPEEKALFEVPNDVNSDEMKIARDILCNRGNDLRQVKIHDFRKYMDNDKILDHCSKMLYDSLLYSDRQFQGENNFQQRNKHFQTNVQDIKDLLRTIDKYLFVMFRNEEITLDQLKARIAEKNHNVKYVVLDDLRKSLQPEILEGVPDEIFYKLYKTEKNSDGK